MLEHPGTGEFHTKGMVLGFVQSGKTTNFTSVIAKAADAGYRFFIVLSGIHDGLRQQTQARLDEQLVAPKPQRWIALTDPNQDFRPNVNVNAFLGGEQKVLCVIKKNGTRLRHLRDWLQSAQESILRGCPTIIIDDEADQASINTARDQNHPSTINRRIREILEALPKAAYVGYTATPVREHPDRPRPRRGPLSPRLHRRSAPAREYVGPETIFGREPLQHDDDDDPSSEGSTWSGSSTNDELGVAEADRADISGFAPEVTRASSRRSDTS